MRELRLLTAMWYGAMVIGVIFVLTSYYAGYGDLGLGFAGGVGFMTLLNRASDRLHERMRDA